MKVLRARRGLGDALAIPIEQCQAQTSSALTTGIIGGALLGLLLGGALGVWVGRK